MGVTALTGFDAAVLGILGLSALIGLSRGFTKEVLSIAGWIGAGYAAYKLYPLGDPIARTYLSPPILADVATGVAIFVVSLILLSLVFTTLANRVKDSVLGPVDRSLGVLFGLARGALVVCLSYLVMALLLPAIDRPAFVRQGQTRPLVEEGAILLYQWAPLPSHGNIEGKIRGESATPDPGSPKGEPSDDDEPQSAPDRPEQTGYKTDQAQSLDRLIRSKQGK